MPRDIEVEVVVRRIKGRRTRGETLHKVAYAVLQVLFNASPLRLLNTGRKIKFQVGVDT